MTVGKTKRKKQDEKKKKSSFEDMIFLVLQKSLKTAVETAMEDIFKDWNKK